MAVAAAALAVAFAMGGTWTARDHDPHGESNLPAGSRTVSEPERPAPRLHAVEIRGFAFVPAELTVAPGDTIVWTNRDFVPHTATADDRSWDSGELATGEAWRLVVDGPATYRCLLHPSMTAALMVEGRPGQ